MAKSGGGTAAGVERLVRPAIEALGLCLWDVRFEKEGAVWVLRVLIDRPGRLPMDTDICEAASRAIDPILDLADPIEQSYFLEVGSPGLGRQLLRPEHFAAWNGQEVTVRLYAPNEDGRKEISGILLGFENGTAKIDSGGKTVFVPQKKAALFKACDDADLFR